MKFPISLLTAVIDLNPSRHTMSWLDLTALLSEPNQTPCTRQTCRMGPCPYKRIACWSPASFVDKRNVEALSLLVFDINQQTDDQIDEIRGRLGGLQYLMHSTHSDRPDSRCLRIVIALSRSVPKPMWKPFFHAAQLSLVPAADPASADAGRVYFLPSCPRDADFFTQVNEGRPLDVDTLLTTIPSSQIEK